MLWHMPKERIVSLFKNGANQALRIPVDLSFDSDKALLTTTPEGAIIISPFKKKQTFSDLLKEWAKEPDIEEEFPEIDDPPPEPVNLF